MRLGSVFQQYDVTPLQGCGERIHIYWVPIQVDGYDGTRAWADGRQHAFDAQVHGRGVHLCGYGRSARCGDTSQGGGAGVGWKDYFVAGPYPLRKQHEGYRVRAGGHTDCMLHTHEVGELTLEGGHLLAKDKPSTLEHAVHGGTKLDRKRVVLRAQRAERYRDYFFQAQNLNGRGTPLPWLCLGGFSSHTPGIVVLQSGQVDPCMRLSKT